MLGVGLADFLSPKGAADTTPVVAVIPAHSVSVTKSSDGKCELKAPGPVDPVARFERYGLAIQPGGVLTSEPHELDSEEHISVLNGTVTAQSSPSERKVRHGESACYPMDVQCAILNVGKAAATTLLVVEYA